MYFLFIRNSRRNTLSGNLVCLTGKEYLEKRKRNFRAKVYNGDCGALENGGIKLCDNWMFCENCQI